MRTATVIFSGKRTAFLSLHFFSLSIFLVLAVFESSRREVGSGGRLPHHYDRTMSSNRVEESADENSSNRMAQKGLSARAKGVLQQNAHPRDRRQLAHVEVKKQCC
jgi:hypothetical protein